MDRGTENDKMTSNPLKCDLVPTGLDLNFQFNGKALLVRIFLLAKAVRLLASRSRIIPKMWVSLDSLEG